MPSLNFDVFHNVLDFCSQDTLRQAALASRDLRAIALTKALFCIPCLVELGENSHNVAVQRMDHALKFKIPIRFGVYYESYEPNHLHDGIRKTIKAVLCPKLHATAHLVKEITIVGPWTVIHDLRRALLQPFPWLRSLTLYTGRMSPDALFKLSNVFFSQSAPFLKSVRLLNVVPGEIPLTAFKEVRDLQMHFTHYAPSLDIARHFPSAIIIELMVHSLNSNNYGINLRGFSQRPVHLVIKSVEHVQDMQSKLRHLLAIDKIPTVSWLVTPDRLLGIYICYHWYLVGLSTAGDVSVHVGYQRRSDSEENVVVVSAQSNGLQRNVLLDKCFNPLAHVMQTFRTRITDLRLNLTVTSDWIKIFTTGLPALKRLHLELGRNIFQRDLRVYKCIVIEQEIEGQFDALIDLILTAVDEDVLLTPTEVADLGRLLHQAERKPDARITLHTFGIQFDGSRSPLSGVFSKVYSDDRHRVRFASLLDLSGRWGVHYI